MSTHVDVCFIDYCCVSDISKLTEFLGRAKDNLRSIQSIRKIIAKAYADTNADTTFYYSQHATQQHLFFTHSDVKRKVADITFAIRDNISTTHEKVWKCINFPSPICSFFPRTPLDPIIGDDAQTLVSHLTLEEYLESQAAVWQHVIQTARYFLKALIKIPLIPICDNTLTIIPIPRYILCTHFEPLPLAA